MSVSVTITVKVYHCTIGDGLFDGQVGLGTHSVSKGKFDDDCNGDGTYKRTLTFTHSHRDGSANRRRGVRAGVEAVVLHGHGAQPDRGHHAIELDPDNG